MRQRAALLRTLLFDTDVILLDEPFGALDAQTKLQMQEWLMQDLWSDFKKTVVFVTHDVEEAIYLSRGNPRHGHAAGSHPRKPFRSRFHVPAFDRLALTPDFIAIKERCMTIYSRTAGPREAACMAIQDSRRRGYGNPDVAETVTARAAPKPVRRVAGAADWPRGPSSPRSSESWSPSSPSGRWAATTGLIERHSSGRSPSAIYAHARHLLHRRRCLDRH